MSDSAYSAGTSPRAPVVGELLDAEDAAGPRAHPQLEPWLKLLSHWMDSAFVVPRLGWRFGLDPIIGLVPVVGDAASTLLSLYILSLATHLRVPRSTMAWMTLNVGIDYVLGSIPLIGNVFDFAWKANDRNMKLLERALETPPHERRRQSVWDWIILVGVVVLLVAMFVASIAFGVLAVTWISQLFRSAATH